MYNKNRHYFKSDNWNETEITTQKRNNSWNYCQAWMDTETVLSPHALSKLIIK